MAGSPGNPVTRVVVVIPAHDEREGIRACVDSVLAAAAEVDVPVTVRVVLDTCTDGTGEHVPDGVETRTVAVRNVGAARAAGVDDADGGADVWLAHTDADTIVGAEWLRRQLAHADAVAAACPGAEFRILDRAHGWVEDPWPDLCAADVVVCAAGQNSMADVAAAGRRAIVLPLPRPYGEQDATARVLSDAGLALVPMMAGAEPPEPDCWPGLLDRAPAADWSAWGTDGAADRAADVIGEVARG